ncbi:WD40-repeat-containing domain protein [Sordaria sp. MPI-SDFR-AT-0083]|nr:WD40-repeat-containing domain protein [Sordaria sp. MPI-SDFR-AT-0083]
MSSVGEGAAGILAGRKESEFGASFSRTNTPGSEVKDKSKSKNFFLRSLTLRGRSSSSKYNDFDSDSEFGGDPRMNGFNARVFSQAVGYTPHHKEPPRYIRTKAANKKERDFGRVFLAQELVGTRPPGYNTTRNTQQEGNKQGQEGGSSKGDAPAQGGETNGGSTVTVSVAGAGGHRKVAKTGGAIWATEFSRDGKYFAAAGKDNVVRVWAVISTPEERRAHEEEEAAATGGTTGERLSAPVFRDRPVHEFVGHTGEVLDLSWSKNNFLLSSSMDKTVRLWHISRQECLCTFKHKDFVTRLAFHPRDDRFFLAGSLDTILRLWSIPDKTIAFSAQCPDLITAVAFSPDGKTAIAGLLNGLCLFYETEGLKPQAQVHVRSSRGKNAKGSKITGIQTISVPPPDPLKEQTPDSEEQGEVKVLITSNDSRVRIYNLRDKSLEIKLKGHDNSVSQIAASFSDDGKYVICGSEDKKAFIWGLNGGQQRAAYMDKEKSPYEYFEAHGEMVTTAVFAPTKTRMLLGRSEDPIYDLCNPPPVLLRSAGEEEVATASATHSAAASQTELSSEDHHPPAPIQRPEPSPAYIARSTHYDGNIIVTTDDTGIIKVFRQDCAYAKRKHDSWETGSTFSRKLTSHGGSLYNGRLGRSISVLSRTSAGTGSAAHSRRGSMSGNNAPYMVTSPVSHASALNQAVNAGSDRILSWRMGIENGPDAGGNGVAGPRPGAGAGQVGPAPGNRSSAIVNGSNRWSGVQTPTHSDRSLSPVRPIAVGNRASMPAAVSVPSTPNRNANANGTSTPNGATNGYPHGHSHLATHTEANSNLLESPANLTPMHRVNTMGTGTELGSPTRSVPMDITPERNRQAREREEKEKDLPAPGFSFRSVGRTGTGDKEERRGSQPLDQDQTDGGNSGNGGGSGNGSGSGGISFWNPLKGMGWKVGIPGFGSKSSTPSNSSGQRPGSSGVGLDKEGGSAGNGGNGKGHNRSMSAGVKGSHADEEGSYGVSPGITPWDVPLGSSVQTQSSGHGRRKSLGVFSTITGGNKGDKDKGEKGYGEREVMRKPLPVGPLLATTDDDDLSGSTSTSDNYANGFANGYANSSANSNGHARTQSQSSGTITGLQRPPLIVPTIINTRPSGDEEDRPELDLEIELEREKEVLQRERELERERQRERERERSKEREKQRERSKERQRMSYSRMSWSRLGMGGLAGRARANSDIAEREEEE